MKNVDLYQPDILNCIANLSNDEVFTPPEIANQMLDLLPGGIWQNPDATFLDPAAKSGVFLREIIKRLDKGLEVQIPDLQQRIDHICTKQVFAIAITELTALSCRRSAYCSKFANGQYSICNTFETADGNVRFQPTEHGWNKDGKCVYCGANKEQYERSDDLESHAYEFIHTIRPEEIWNMKFDVIVSNPPYQLSDGGNSASAMPIYQKFVSQAKKLNPHYLTMIIPSRWFTGGRGLDSFRNEMLTDKHVKELYDFSDSKDCFPGVDISGGICYFLWDIEHNGKCRIINYRKDSIIEDTRSLDEFSVFIRDNNAVSIIKKVMKKDKEMLKGKVSGQRPFGFRTFARPTDTGDIILRWNQGKGNIELKTITSGRDMINKWKVIISRVGYEHAGHVDKNGMRRVLSILEVLKPHEVCTETYIVIDAFDNEEEAKNLKTYLSTKFVRFLIAQISTSVMISKNSFSFVPVQDFSKSWTDEELYAKYGLSKDEITFIESMIKPME